MTIDTAVLKKHTAGKVTVFLPLDPTTDCQWVADRLLQYASFGWNVIVEHKERNSSAPPATTPCNSLLRDSGVFNGLPHGLS